RRTYDTLPFGPQAQTLYLSRENAALMARRKKLTQDLMALLGRGEKLENLDDFICSEDYLEAISSGRVSLDDLTLMFSIDGAQLYEHKASDCWIYIWVIFELGADKRYKKRYVFP
ncbi:hypothetical protein C2E23DRAFT_690008, partial [Lenzites betulinus]